jgi:carbon storage regulator
MLVLTRRPGQSIRIGPNVEVRVVRLEGDRVVLGIAAPRYVAVVRSELIEEVSGEIRDASETRAKLRVMLWPHALDGSHAGPAAPTEQRDGPEDDPSIA